MSTSSQRKAAPAIPTAGRADVGDVAERGPQERGSGERAGELRGPVADGAAPGEVAAEREGEGHARVEVGAGDVADGVDPEHDHEAERDRDADVAELVVFASTMIAPHPAKTSANVPIASATSGRRCAVLTVVGKKLGHQPLHALVDLVADHTHRLDILAGRIVELPVLVALAGIDRAGVAAPHRDHDVCGRVRTRR